MHPSENLLRCAALRPPDTPPAHLLPVHMQETKVLVNLVGARVVRQDWAWSQGARWRPGCMENDAHARGARGSCLQACGGSVTQDADEGAENMTVEEKLLADSQRVADSIKVRAALLPQPGGPLRPLPQCPTHPSPPLATHVAGLLRSCNHAAAGHAQHPLTALFTALRRPLLSARWMRCGQTGQPSGGSCRRC